VLDLGLAGVGHHLHGRDEQRLLAPAEVLGLGQIAADAIDEMRPLARAVEQRRRRATRAVAVIQIEPVEFRLGVVRVTAFQAHGQGLAGRVVHLDQVGEQTVLGLDPLADIFGQVAHLGVGGALLHEDEGHGRGDAGHGDRQHRDDRQQPPGQWRVHLGVGSKADHALSVPLTSFRGA
jgi:hypothetical protein